MLNTFQKLITPSKLFIGCTEASKVQSKEERYKHRFEAVPQAVNVEYLKILLQSDGVGDDNFTSEHCSIILPNSTHQSVCSEHNFCRHA